MNLRNHLIEPLAVFVVARAVSLKEVPTNDPGNTLSMEFADYFN